MGDLVVMHVTAREDSRILCGALLYPATDNDLLKLTDAQSRSMNSEVDRIALSRAVKTLTLPGEMGERFQVMALGKGYDHALRGFASRDLSYRL